MDYILAESEVPVQKRKHGISGSTLKIIAVFFMLLDFVGLYILETHVFDISQLAANGSANGFSPYELTDLIFRMLGGIAFPIFCFLLVEGFLNTSDIKKYALRLLVCALLTECIWDLVNGNGWFYWGSQNVLFTLLIGLITLFFIQKYSGNIALQSLFFFIGIIFCCILNTDFGSFGYGVILISFMYAARSRKLFFNVFGPLITIVASIFNGYLFALLAFFIIHFYNGKRGFKCTYLFYAIYPVSLLIFHLIGFLL